MMNRRTFVVSLMAGAAALSGLPKLDLPPLLYSDGVHDDGPWFKWMVENGHSFEHKKLHLWGPFPLKLPDPPKGCKVYVRNCTFVIHKEKQ